MKTQAQMERRKNDLIGLADPYDWLKRNMSPDQLRKFEKYYEWNDNVVSMLLMNWYYRNIRARHINYASKVLPILRSLPPPIALSIQFDTEGLDGTEQEDEIARFALKSFDQLTAASP